MTLFGRQYSVRGQGSKEYIDSLVEFINARVLKIKEKTQVVTTLDLAILTLLNVTDELFECRLAIQEGIEKVEEKNSGLLEPSDLREIDCEVPLRGS